MPKKHSICGSLKTLSEAAKSIPGGVKAGTVRRWITRGLHGRKLKAKQVGNRYMVDENELVAFATADVNQ